MLSFAFIENILTGLDSRIYPLIIWEIILYVPEKDVALDLGITIDTSLKFHKHVSSIVCKASAVANNLLKCTVNRDVKFMSTLYISQIRPLLEYNSAVWNLGYIGDVKALESVQRRWTKCIGGLENLQYFDRLKALNLFSVRGRLLRHDLIKIWHIIHSKSSLSFDNFFQLPTLHTTRGHQYKLAHVRTNLDIRKRSFAVRNIGLWNSLPEYVVSSTNVNTFKAALTSYLGDLLFEYCD